MNVIKITVDGPVQTGKSAVLQSIKGMLEGFNYCAVIPEREERNNPSDGISSSEFHERPNPDRTVFVLEERCTKEK